MMAFFEKKHSVYIKRISADTESFQYVVTQHLRMSGIYWGLTGISLLGSDLSDMNIDGIVDWLLKCEDPETGGFGGSIGHDSHMLYTLSAVQILALSGNLDKINCDKVAQYVASLQQPDGSFSGDKWGEIDTRFSYCAVNALSLLGKLHSGLIDIEKTVDFVCRCQNFDGGYGAVPGAESHAGQIFCCVGALSICNAVHRIDADLLGWWLSERQCDSGGLNGRPEKQADVCYSWWILSCLSIIGRVSWIDRNRLVKFILECQDEDAGGIADRPGDIADIFHTFFGICGLSLLGYFDKPTDGSEWLYPAYREIDPTYALPRDVVASLNLPYQRLPAV